MSNRKPPPKQSPNTAARDLKHRVFTCLSKLSDRDTHSVAAAELESIAKTLSSDSFSPFLSCLQSTDSSDKSPVRQQCVKLVTFLSLTYGNSLSPHISKLLSAVVRRLRDSDSAVRTACVAAVSTIASHVTKPPFSAISKPLIESLFTEQDLNSQTGFALCLAAAIESSPEPDSEQLEKLLPRIVKLAKCESFKAKSAVLTLIGSVIGAVGCESPSVMKNLVSCLSEFLCSEDWTARKSASESLAKLAVVERDSLSEFKSSCLKLFESRRFDKVKAVRESMNQMLEEWKEVPDESEEVSPPPQSHSSSRDITSDDQYPPGCKNSGINGTEALKTMTRRGSTRTPPPTSISPATGKRSLLKNADEKTSSSFQKLDCKKISDRKSEAAVAEGFEDDYKGKDSRKRFSKPEAKQVNKNSDEKMQKSGGFRSGSRVAPCPDCGPESTVVVSNNTEDICWNNKECEELSLIRKQLVQIENQQSSLLDLLQKFMGSSQNGMQSLETRVQGLEMALDEISFDLAVTSGRMSHAESAVTTCCIFPGADFLSSKLCRRAEGRPSISQFSSFRGTPSVGSMRDMGNNSNNTQLLNMQKRRLRSQGGGGFIVNPLAEIHSNSRSISGGPMNGITQNINTS
ncbi:HEAT repeat [Dillenia turbinata]|uniref:HEAT repeat n=1 Tax=Dillenia turbinata TaxID=194707 RepID=A0AAN8Z188_9MAGN